MNFSSINGAHRGGGVGGHSLEVDFPNFIEWQKDSWRSEGSSAPGPRRKPYDEESLGNAFSTCYPLRLAGNWGDSSHQRVSFERSALQGQGACRWEPREGLADREGDTGPPFRKLDSEELASFQHVNKDLPKREWPCIGLLMGGFNPWHHYPTRAISPGSAPWCESGGYVVVLAVGSVSTAAKKVEVGRGATLSTEMRVPWGKLGALSHKINPLGALSQSHHQQGPTADAARNGHQTARNVDTPPTTTTHAIPGAPKSRWNIRSSSKRMKRSSSADKTEAQPQSENEVKVDIVEEENSDLLGGIVMTGTLALPGKLIHKNVGRSEVTAKLTTKAFLWSLRCLCLDNIVAVSCYNGSKRFTIHSFASMRTRWVPKAFGKERRSRSDLHFYGSTPDEALGWVAAFAQQGCYVNFLPNPNPSKKGSAKEDSAKATVKCRASPQMLVILNPKSGRGLARKVFRKKVQPILELAGFKLTIVETTGARHAQNMAMQLDLSTCPDGIICVGGDGIINEVLNGLLGRHDAARASTIPIGIIPAGSDNSLVWTILGVKDATTAALAIVKGGTVATDVFTVEWEKTGATHLGHTVTYYGFMSDVLELSAKYQGRFGPLRYFVAGAIRLLYLPKYKCEVRYLPAEDLNLEVKTADSLENPLDAAKGPIYDSDTEIVVEPRQSNNDGMLPSSHSRIGSEIEFFGVPTDAANEPSDYVRGLDYKAKRSPLENRYSSPAVLEEVIAGHPLGGGASPSPRSRSRSKSRSDCGSGLSAMTPDMIRSSRSSPQLDKYETGVGGSCLGDNIANSVGRRWGPLEGVYDPKAGSIPQIEPVFRIPSEHHQTDDEWVVKQGPFLGVMICNHECKTVQCLESQAMAPTAEYDDGTLDLLLVRCVGRFQLLRFILAMQFNRHLSLPFVEYIKVKKVMLIPNKKGHLRCGIDGELLTLDGPITTSILPYQCQLIGSARKRS